MFSGQTKKDEKAIMTETFDNMFAFAQHNGEIDYETSKKSEEHESKKSTSSNDHQKVDKPEPVRAISTSSEDGGGKGDPDCEKYEYPPLILKYENKSTTYWPNLDKPSSDALNSLKEWIEKEQIELDQLTKNDLHPNLLLLRYLRAFKFDVDKTKTHLVQSIEVFKSKDVASIVLQRPEDILGCSLEDLTAVFPHWHSGYDKTGRPVLFKQYGKFEAKKIRKLAGGTFDNVVKYHIWEQEACARLCLEQSKKLKQIIEAVNIVIDIEDMTIVQVTGEFMTLIKLLAAVDSQQYPETVGRIFIINAFTSFHVVWAMVKPWIVPATASKIKVLSGPAEYTPVLIDFIGEDNLPSNYGGKLPPLSSKVHPYAKSMESYDGNNATESEGADTKKPADDAATTHKKGWFYN